MKCKYGSHLDEGELCSLEQYLAVTDDARLGSNRVRHFHFKGMAIAGANVPRTDMFHELNGHIMPVGDGHMTGVSGAYIYISDVGEMHFTYDIGAARRVFNGGTLCLGEEWRHLTPQEMRKQLSPRGVQSLKSLLAATFPHFPLLQDNDF